MKFYKSIRYYHLHNKLTSKPQKQKYYKNIIKIIVTIIKMQIFYTNLFFINMYIYEQYLKLNYDNTFIFHKYAIINNYEY